MAKSRYSGTPVIGKSYLGTWKLPDTGLYSNVDLLDGVATIDHVYSRGERFDHLASRYFDEEEYWWVIALVNKITYPFGLAPGTVLKIPVSVSDVVDKILP